MPDSEVVRNVVVVGASLAGLRAVETLRTEGFDGGITVVGAEPHMPYDRPPLSKKLLAGEWEPDRVALRKPDDLATLGVMWHLGVPAVSLDPEQRLVHLEDGTAAPYEGLIVATGASPRRLPGQPDPDRTDGLFELRTMDHALALREELQPGRRVVVIGAGFIGLEAAATARQRGCDVTVLEGLPTPLVRALGAGMGTAVAAVQERHGVSIRCDVQVDLILVDRDGPDSDDGGARHRVRGVRLGDGEEVPADVVVVGIGVTPNTSWLEGTPGIEVRDGVVCDATLAVGPPLVYAAGDLVRWTNLAFGPEGTGEEMRVEHWTNAAEQGAAAARNLLAVASGGVGVPYSAVPFFWSDQFDARVQFLGRAGVGDDVVVVAGDPEQGAFVALYGRDGLLRGALGVSMPRLVMPYRALLARRATWAEALDHAAGNTTA